MRIGEKNAILRLAAFWSDKKLEDEYYKSAYDCLGSDADRMEELGYEAIDIRERRQYEKYLCEQSDILASLCYARGIELWKKESGADTQENQDVNL